MQKIAEMDNLVLVGMTKEQYQRLENIAVDFTKLLEARNTNSGHRGQPRGRKSKTQSFDQAQPEAPQAP